MKNKLPGILTIISLFGLSIYRDILFKSINAIYNNKIYYNTNIKIPEHIIALKRLFSLSILKWGLTAILTVLFIILHLLSIYFFFGKNRLYESFKIISMPLIFVLLSALFGVVISNFELVYPVIRIVTGFIHTPLFSLILITYFSFKQKEAL